MISKDEIIRALVLKYTEEFDYYVRNPNYDRSKRWDDDWELYDRYLPPQLIPMSERAKRQPYIHFTASDGGSSMRAATIEEIADTIIEYLNDDGDC